MGIKIDTQIKNKQNKNDINLQETKEEGEILSNNINIPFSELITKETNQLECENNFKYLSSLPVDYNFDSIMVDINDAMFFVNLTKEGQFSVESAQNGDFKNLIKLEIAQTNITQKTVEVTNQITSLIEKAQKTQKPVRITFDNDVSVIIKIDKRGRVTAEFIPGSAEVEAYLRNNITALRQKFDEQNLPYNELFYRQNNKQQNKQKQQKNKGE